MRYKSISPVIRLMLDTNQYEARVRQRIVYDIEGNEYELVGLPDWPAYKDAIERGEYRLVLGMTGNELAQAYKEFNRVQGRLFHEPGISTGMAAGQQQSSDSTKLDVRAVGDSGERSGENVDNAGQGNNDRASERGGEGEDVR